MHNPEQEILQRFSFLGNRLPAVHGGDVIVPLAIVIFPWARYNYWQIIVHGYRNKNHIFCEKSSSHNYVATLISLPGSRTTKQWEEPGVLTVQGHWISVKSCPKDSCCMHWHWCC